MCRCGRRRCGAGGDLAAELSGGGSSRWPETPSNDDILTTSISSSTQVGEQALRTARVIHHRCETTSAPLILRSQRGMQDRRRLHRQDRRPFIALEFNAFDTGGHAQVRIPDIFRDQPSATGRTLDASTLCSHDRSNCAAADDPWPPINACLRNSDSIPALPDWRADLRFRRSHRIRVSPPARRSQTRF